MMYAIKKKEGFVRAVGNPTILSLDGKRKAPLRVILHKSWTDEERAEYGVYPVSPLKVPRGKRVKGKRTLIVEEGVVTEIAEFEDEPNTKSLTPKQKVEKLAWEFGLTVDELKKELAQ